MLNSLFKFLKGYVIIELYGRHVERFLNICTRRGIGVRDIHYGADGTVRACIEQKKFKLLRPIAYKTRTKVHIVKKKGFFDLRFRYGKRYGLLAGIAVGIIFIFAAPHFIWTVEISGNDEVPEDSIVQALHEAGIYRGAWKGKIPDGFEVKRIILNNNPNLIWAWAYIKGTNADVRVYERELPPLIVDRDTPCSIAAACDAYVESVRAFNGERIEKGGNAVRAGDILISGKVGVYKEGYPEKYMYVHAQGDIVSYTQRSESGVYRQEYESRTPTGRAVSKPYIDIFGKRINLYRSENCGFDEYDSEEFGKSFAGVLLGGTRYKEVAVSSEPMSLDGTLQRAKEELEQKIAKKLCKNAELIDEDLQYEYISDKEIEVKLTMSFKEDIGTEVPIETEETIIDKQEN